MFLHSFLRTQPHPLEGPFLFHFLMLKSSSKLHGVRAVGREHLFLVSTLAPDFIPLPFLDLGNTSSTLWHVAPPEGMAAMSLPLLPDNKEIPELIHGLKFKFLHQCAVPCPALCLDLHAEVVHSAVGSQVSSVTFTL